MEKMQIIWVAHSYTPQFFSIKKHRHPYYHMIYIVKGTLRFVVKDETYFLSEKQCILIPKNTDHAFFNDGEDCGEYLEVKFTLLKSAFETHFLKDIVRFSDNELVGYLTNQILKEYYTLSNCDEAAVSYLRSILNILCEQERYDIKTQFRFFAAFDYSKLSQKVIRYLEEHYHEEISLNSLANEMNLNKNYLCAVFKKDTKRTILDCLNAIRIRRAAELIVYSEYSLLQVAEACGFASVSHFNRVFLKYVGITPGQCRRAYPAGTLDFPKDADASAFSNNFMYNVLAHKPIALQDIKNFDTLEKK